MASAGCRKKAGVPVLDSVAAILRQMMPDLPMPVTMTRPRHSSSSRTARSKRSSRRSTQRENGGRLGLQHLAGERQVDAGQLTASRRARVLGGHRFARRGVDALQLADQRLEPVEAQRVGGVALGARRLLVDFHEHRVDAGGDAGGGQRLDVLAPARRSRRRRRRAAAGCG